MAASSLCSLHLGRTAQYVVVRIIQFWDSKNINKSGHFMGIILFLLEEQSIIFLWVAISGWLFRVIIVATCVLPIAGPLFISVVASNFVIKGECPACKRLFIGYKNQVIRCKGCRNIVWQPQGDFFSRDGNNNNKGNSKLMLILRRNE